MHVGRLTGSTGRCDRVDHVGEKQISCIPGGSYRADELSRIRKGEENWEKKSTTKDQLVLLSIVSNFAAAELTKVIAVVAQACLESIYSVDRIERG